MNTTTSSRGYRTRTGRSQRGTVLAFTLVISMIVFGIAVLSLRAVLAQTKMARQTYRMYQAMAVAEAGIELGLNELNKPKSGPRFTTWTTSDNIEYSMEDALTGNDGVLLGDYAVTVIDPMSATPMVEATGFIPSRDDPQARRSVRVVAVDNRERSRYAYAIETLEYMSIDGGGDSASWHASNGNPPSSPVQCNAYGNMASHGDMYMANGTDVFGSIEAEGDISGGVSVNGLNVDGQPNTMTSNGDIAAPPDYPDDDHEAAKITNDNLTGITPPSGMTINQIYDPVNKTLISNQNNKTITLAPGVYFFTKIDIAGNNSQIVISPAGEAKIYLEAPDPNDIVFHLNNGASVNPTGSPGNLEILIKQGRVWWENAGTIRCPVFAPNSDIIADNAFDLFGSIVCKTIDIKGGGMFVYDESLGNPSAALTGVRVLAWLEVSPLE